MAAGLAPHQDAAPPKTKKALADEARSAKRATEDKAIARAHSRRRAHQAAEPERYQGVEALPGHVSHKQSYRDMDIGVQHETNENVVGQQHLPGMEHPATVNTPTRWEDMSSKDRTRVTRNAAKFGVTHASAVQALGAQVDQGALREGALGQRHASFYAAEGHQPSGEMTPRTRLLTSARDNDVPFEQQAIANSITSPKSEFARTPKSGPFEGQRIYPNDANATEAIHYAKQNRPMDARAAASIGGMHGNVRKASLAVENMQYGASAREAWKAGPKTGPYHNSWVDPHGSDQFWVSDIHSGGGGIAPHLTVPERENYLNIDGIHAFNDHVARTVAAQRGVTSLTGMQSMQWNEERHRRYQQDSRYGEQTEAFSGAGKTSSDHEVHGQTDIFGGTHHVEPTAAPKPPNHDHEMTGKDIAAANAIAAARSSKRSKERLEAMRPEAEQTLKSYLENGHAASKPMDIAPIRNAW